MMDLLRVDPYFIRIVSGSSMRTSDPGKSKKHKRDNNNNGSLVSFYRELYNNSKVKNAVALLATFPNSFVV
jgi:hypothetical protein